ncbi:MAG: PEP-CTERM sorting domain-containing protein [Phycisphaeraceae bacterium]
MNTKLLTLIVCATVAMLTAANHASASSLHIMVFEHDAPNATGTGYGFLTAVMPTTALDKVTGTIDDAWEVPFETSSTGMHVGGTWGLDSLDDVAGYFDGDWTLNLESGGSVVSQPTFSFDGDALAAGSPTFPAKPTITGTTRDGSDLSIHWQNNDPATQLMLAGAVDWANAGALTLTTEQSISSRSATLPGIADAAHELLVGSLVTGPEGIVTNFQGDNADWDNGSPSFWLGSVASQMYEPASTVIPEPTSLGLLAVAAAGLTFRRRRRHTTTA